MAGTSEMQEASMSCDEEAGLHGSMRAEAGVRLGGVQPQPLPALGGLTGKVSSGLGASDGDGHKPSRFNYTGGTLNSRFFMLSL